MVISSGYLTQPSRSRGRHRKQPPPRLLALRGAGLRRIGGPPRGARRLRGALVKWATHQPVSQPNARPSTPVAPSPSSSPAPPAVHRGRAGAAPDLSLSTQGLRQPGARCDGTQSAVAIGRTPGSLVVICGDRNGRYGYRGVRLSDDAVLTTSPAPRRSTSSLRKRERDLLDLPADPPCHRRRRGDQAGADVDYADLCLRSAPRNRRYRTQPVSARTRPVE